MANASTTQPSSASSTTGTPIALAYGPVWATGKRHAYFQLQDTGSSWMDYHRVGIWMLGDDEWDGPEQLYINDHLTWRGYNPGPAVPGFSGQQWQVGLDNKWNFVFNFHSGTDAVIGSGLTPSSNGPDQGVDVLWAQFPSAINRTPFSRTAYYAIMRKQPIENQSNDHRDDPSQWTDIDPIGLWRSRRCRLFDQNGGMAGYAYTTNPAWHFVDLILKRKLFSEYALSAVTGPDDLTDAIRARFNWASIWDSAQYYDEILSNGRRRFEGSYVFAQQSTLQASIEQILLVSRSFAGEPNAGEIWLNCDKPRSSVFTFSRDNIMPGSFEGSDQSVNTGGNRFICTLRDILVPAIDPTIVSIVVTAGRPVVTMSGPHPFAATDWLAIGGTDTVYDSEWQVYSVPAITGVGTPAELDPVAFTMVPKGANYPSSVGAGGRVGLLYARFKERAPIWDHKANQQARGAIGNGLPRERNRVKHPLDFASSTYDQVRRITLYERDRALGADTTGTDGRLASAYITPKIVKLRTPLFAKDKFGNLAAQVRPGDRVTVDDTVNFQYAGEYEVQDGHTIYPPNCEVETQNGSLVRTPVAGSGEIEFPLRTYDESVMTDDTDDAGAGWFNVPGSDPGNSASFTQIDLASGVFVFFTGKQSSGSQFQLPSTGFPAANLLDWASASGANTAFHSMRVIQLCDADANRNLTLTYNDDDGTTWHGDVGFAAVSWLSSDVPTSSGGMTWLELTLLGGEKILFGRGIFAHGASLPALPSGYSLAQAFATAYVHDTPTSTTHNPRIVGAKVDPATGAVSCTYDDGAGNTWHGNAAVLLFAWKNNMGTVTTETDTNTNWMEVTLSNGKKFGVGCALNIPDGTAIHLPAAAGSATTLQAIVGTSTFTVPPGAGHTYGVDTCDLDTSNVVHVTFGAGTDDSPFVSGVGDVFLLYCESGSAAPALVTVSPASATLNQGMQQQFSAVVQNNANQSVTWSVDGIAGGNVTVGTIDSSGLFTSPNSAGTHTITATSVAVPTASGNATVAITSTGDGSGGYLVNGV